MRIPAARAASVLRLCRLVAGVSCFLAGCGEKTPLPVGGSSTGAESGDDPSATLGPPPDLGPSSTSTADVEPEPIPCGEAEGKVCGKSGDVLRHVDDLASLSGCEVYRGSINLAGTETQADLAPLSSLRAIMGGLVVTYTGLETLDGLECLELLGSLSVTLPAPALRDISALRNVSLVPANGWPDRLLYIAVVDNLASLEGLQSITAVVRLDVTGNANLADLEGLSGLERVDEAIRINENPLLTDLAGLRNVVEFEGQLDVSRSEKLRSLDGLEQVDTLSSLQVLENPVLTSLDGLVGLEHVTGDVEFRDNPMLQPAEIDELLAHVEVDGEVILE